MSLIKQLWIGIIIMLLLAMGGSFFISLLSAKHYLEEQLHVKNMDNANSLALSLSQMEKDPVTFELLISAQFDTGHYDYIVLTDPQKNIIVSRQYNPADKSQADSDVPQWFTQLMDFDADPGIAQVQDGWQQYGTLSLKSQSRYAWQALWKSASQLLGWFVLAALICGAVGTSILKFISSPLDIVIKQAEAIGERRFITSDEPKTTEFQRLVRAMNSLSESVKVMLEKETKKLEQMRKESQLDGLTDLPNRNHFLNLLESLLSREDSGSNGVLVLVRVLNIGELNNRFGRTATDNVLLQIAGVFHQFIEQYPGSYAGRLNGSDFMLVISGNPTAEVVGAELAEKLNTQLKSCNLTNVHLPIAACTYSAGEKRNDLLHMLDGGLAQAELKGNNALVVLTNNKRPLAYQNLGEWRDVINEALDKNLLELAEFPVKQANGDILHYEAPVRLQLHNELQPAGYFMPWAARLGIMHLIDLQVINIALQTLKTSRTPIAINISADALCNAQFREQALAVIARHVPQANHLWIEFPESCALRHLAELRNFALDLRNLGCHVGLEHVGLEFTKIRELQDIGLHYLKIDGAIIRDIDSNQGNQSFLQALCKIGSSLGMIIIAEGVSTELERDTAIKLGAEAVTGKLIQ
ncbi:MAG TPA: EAL domain-containing protein [Cellvibrio sp.]|nr:EAL domain-containing protein [Cellvibrio sp.]